MHKKNLGKNPSFRTSAKTVRVDAEIILQAIRLADKTFGVFEFSHLPAWVREEGGEQPQGGEPRFFEDHYAVVFFPSKVRDDIVAGGSSPEDDSKHLATLKEVCRLLKCSARNKVVVIVPEY